MPEISSAFVLPAAPAASNAAGTAVGTPSTPDRGAGAADFLSQFKAAIKNLASVALPQVATPALAALVSQPDAASAPPPDTKNTDVKQSDLMPEILAALGFVVVPPVLQPPTPAQPPVSDSESQAAAVAATGSPAWPAPTQAPEPSAALAPHTSQLPLSVEALPPSQAPQSPQPTASAEKQMATMTPLLDQLHPTPAPLLDFSPPASAPSLDVPPQLLTQLATRETPVTERPATTRAITSDTPAVVTPQLAQPDPSVTTAVAPRITVAPDAPAAQHPSTAPIVDSATPVVATPPGGTFQHSGFDSNSRQPHSIPLMESDSAITPAQAAPDGTFAAAAAVATPGAAPLPPDIRPSEVVNQIAHQADLYRVPGDRSVHIQLHPEGLGGVDVTLRYSAASGIQLHLNVEHASTGALVQAGWTELRDALATQGIHSDRLVMSISAPANASGPNLNNGNGSNRSDGGLASFTQGQNSQQRQETQEQRTARGWNAAIDPILPSSFDVSQRVAPASAGHIDYRV